MWRSPRQKKTRSNEERGRDGAELRLLSSLHWEFQRLGWGGFLELCGSRDPVSQDALPLGTAPPHSCVVPGLPSPRTPSHTSRKTNTHACSKQHLQSPQSTSGTQTAQCASHSAGAKLRNSSSRWKWQHGQRLTERRLELGDRGFKPLSRKCILGWLAGA